MALTLPYPSLVFVPLDVLTADQMNEIVANYEYIANQFPIGASNIDFSTLSGNYSTTEVDTGYTWTGGQKIYKKTIETGAFSGTGILEKDHGISDFSFPVAIQGWGLDGGLAEFKTLPYVRGEDTTFTGIGIAVTPTKIRIKRNANYVISNSWFTLWYTKTS